MPWNTSLWWSLKTRVALATLAIFLLSFWTLAFYVKQMLHESMQRSVGEQQFSTASFIAASVNEELNDRLMALETIARTLGPTMTRTAPAMQNILEARPLLLNLFNGGPFVARRDGHVIASLPLSAKRKELYIGDRDYFISALQDNKSTVGKPVIGKLRLAPVVVMSAPIRDARGLAMGVLMGATFLDMPSFFDKIADSQYGKTGGYLLVAPQHGLMVTATDKSRIMEVLPPMGTNPLIDRLINGHEGSAVKLDQHGVEVLASTKRIPLAGWIMAVTMPTEEAFAPIKVMERRVLIATLIMSLLGAALTWWVLKRQLSPMLSAAHALNAMAQGSAPQRPLTIDRQDEIGELVSGFNRLMETLRQQETALRANEERMALVLRGTREGVWDWDLQHHERFLSEGFWTMLGYKDGEHRDDAESLRRLIHPDDLQRLAPAFARLLADSMSSWGEAEFRVKCKDGRYLPLAARGFIQRNGSGAATRICGANMDLTERKQAEAELVVARMAAEKANNAKSRFLAAASHDLRQPLAALSLYVSALNPGSSIDDADIVMSIRSCVNSLSSMLTDILDISKLDAGVVTPTLSSFSVDQLLAEIISVQSVEADMRGLQFRWRDSGLIAHSDRALISRILNNLIANAVRHTEQGAVLVACRRHGGKHWVEVWDTGRGIPEDKTELIFDEFTQLGDGARNRGSGLGLSIVAKTAAVLGVEIRLRSRPGKGSMFAVEIPPGCMTFAAEPMPTAPSRQRPARIGLVDDNANVLEALRLVLQRSGHEVVAATSGEALLQALAGRAPDLVIADFRLGDGETGYEVIAATRDLFGHEVPAIVITGDTDPALIRSMSDRGIAVHYKPLQTEALLAFISAAAKRPKSATQHPEAACLPC